MDKKFILMSYHFGRLFGIKLKIFPDVLCSQEIFLLLHKYTFCGCGTSIIILTIKIQVDICQSPLKQFAYGCKIIVVYFNLTSLN